MLTILVGTDTTRRAVRLDALTLAAKKKGAEVRSYSDIDFDPEEMRALGGSVSLFGGSFVVVLSNIADTTERRESLEKIIPALVESTHEFILSESSLLAPFLKKATTKGATVETFDSAAKTKKAEVFNTFLLTDAFSDRNRSLAWSLYRKAIDLGVEPRELHGKLFWAVKTLLIAGGAASVTASGLNPFVYQKAKRSASNFAPGELSQIATELTVLFHEALVSGIDLETALEAFLLRALAK